ncbi:beta-lactamase family protein [Cupriavidus sp. WGtm5]|uniref:serine hydrolase domain-containing protein n=1 Tax=Cupriavidus TaxID=106589 RepID=UPI001F01DE6E|nr:MULTISPECIES: serine hydrolase [Cupriavidus]MCO4891469.1 beta-lactamase family protein [Cupriavidus sp. WGtm5]ULX51786.1 6-aminohexanoate hydrolase [Cupriavidus taiwanensis]
MSLKPHRQSPRSWRRLAGVALFAASLPTWSQPAASAASAAPAAAAPATTVAAALATDPNLMGWMQGFPPPPDKLITHVPGGNRFPRNRWLFSHVRELGPTASVWRGPGPASTLPRAEQAIGAIPFTDADGTRRTFDEMLALTYTDGILVMHQGKVIYERYFGALDSHTPHIAMSVTKSFVGTLAAMLAAEGKLDPAAPVTRYLPEMAGTAYGDATVRQVMDMTIGVRYSEDYADPRAEVWDYARAGGMLARPANYNGPGTFYDFLKTLQKDGSHDAAFAYKTVNAEVLAWIVRRASGQSLAKLLSERIWQPMGAEQDAYFTVDSIGTESGGGGLNTTLRDLARFGETIRGNGRFNGKQIIPASVVADIRRGGSRELFARSGSATVLPGWSYRDMWWVSHDSHGMFQAAGIHGQRIYIDPQAELTIVRYASHPVAGNAANNAITFRAFRAVAEALSR